MEENPYQPPEDNELARAVPRRKVLRWVIPLVVVALIIYLLVPLLSPTRGGGPRRHSLPSGNTTPPLQSSHP